MWRSQIQSSAKTYPATKLETVNHRTTLRQMQVKVKHRMARRRLAMLLQNFHSLQRVVLQLIIRIRLIKIHTSRHPISWASNIAISFRYVMVMDRMVEKLAAS